MTTELETILQGDASARPLENETTTKEPAVEAAQGAGDTASDALDTSGDESSNGQQTVPLAALKEERGKVKRYTEQVAAFQQETSAMRAQIAQLMQHVQRQPQAPQPEAPDFFQDPEGYVRQALTPVAQSQVEMRDQFSRMMASEKHGAEKVNQALNAFAEEARRNPASEYEYKRIMSAPHPYGELVSWFDKQSVMAEIGTDPQAYREKLKAELLAELQGGGAPAAQQQQRGQAPVMPSNLSSARNAGVRSGPTWSGPTSIADIFSR